MIELKNCCLKIGKKELLKNISFKLERGDKLCILGRNGSSKSTLLRAILGFTNLKGEYLLYGEKVRVNQLYKHMSYVAQSSEVRLPFTLFEVVLMGRYSKSTGIFYNKEDKKAALKALELLSLSPFSKQPFTTLSGGEQQLGLIARALCKGSKILVLDEPSSALDLSYQDTLFKILNELVLEGLIFTTHEPANSYIANKTLMMKKGEVLDFGHTKDLLCTEKINKLYNINSSMIELPNGGRYFYHH